MFNSKKLLGLIAGLVLTFSAHAQIFGGSNPILCANGDVVTSPCFAWSLNPRTGFYQPALNQIGVSINGVNVGTWSSTGYSSPFASTATSYFANGGSAPAATGTGLQIWSNTGEPHTVFVDATRTANNRIFDQVWTGGVFSFRFMNDAFNSAASPLTITGGNAAGITGITSNSGSGSWVHTGNFALTAPGAMFSTATNSTLKITGDTSSTTGGGIVLFGTTHATLPNIVSLRTNDTEQVRISPTANAVNYHELTGAVATGAIKHQASGTDTNISMLYLSKGTGQHQFYTNNAGTAALQFAVLNTASASNYITVTGSNGGAPTINTNGGTLQINSSTGSVQNNSGNALTSIGTASAAGVITNILANATEGWIYTQTANPLVLATGGSERMRVPSGQNVFRFSGFTFANIATNLTTGGEIGFCSDCTIANPCAGGGTGAFAKRLNGVNVCN